MISSGGVPRGHGGGVGVGICVGVGVGVKAGVGVGICVEVGVGVKAGVGVSICVGVSTGVKARVGVWVVGVSDAVVGDGLGVDGIGPVSDWQPANSATTTTMNRIVVKKASFITILLSPRTKACFWRIILSATLTSHE